jgi:hypothetical protein
LSGEMMRNSNAEQIVRAALGDALGPALDRVLLGNRAGTPTISPPGLLNGITPLTATTGGGDAAMVGDIKQLVTALAPVSGNGSFVIVASPSQAAVLRMRSYIAPAPILVSGALTNTVIAVATNAVVCSVDTPRIEASRDVLVHEETAPAAIVGGGGTAHPVRSMWQTDSVSLRLVWPVAWVVRSPVGVAYVTGTTW